MTSVKTDGKTLLKVLGILSDEVSLRILHEISKGPCCVADISRRQGVQPPTVWKKIQKFRRAGIVLCSRRTGDAGKMIVEYRLVDMNLGPCTVSNLLSALLT